MTHMTQSFIVMLLVLGVYIFIMSRSYILSKKQKEKSGSEINKET